MNTIKLSGKGQLSLPEQVIAQHHWQEGQEFVVVNAGNGILLRPKLTFPPTKIEDVAGCLAFKGKAKTLDEMEAAIAQGAIQSMKDEHE
jgi:bifunctional DNA-binding transcriptional regulator/antitoxin component of YhaV-PrlF toxin-antitoxin module